MRECEKCKYFVQHYIKKGIYFTEGGGHCISPQRKKYSLKDNCEYFIPNDEKPEEKTAAEDRSIEYCLSEINRRLNFLTIYFANKK